jgi:hypothetical protein
MKRGLAGLAAACLLLAATAARAEEPEESPEMRWYGYQALALDVTAIGLVVVPSALAGCGFSSGSSGCDWRGVEVLGAFSLVVYQFGGPMVHALHGHWPRPIYSGLARLAPVVGSLLVSERAGPRMLVVGALGAMIFDDGFLAHEEVRPARFAVVPTYDPIRRSRGLALAGRF